MDRGFSIIVVSVMYVIFESSWEAFIYELTSVSDIFSHLGENKMTVFKLCLYKIMNKRQSPITVSTWH